MTRGGVEILVHAAAPSRGQDDALYRALAEAYVAFEPQTRHSLLRDDEADELSSSADRDAESQLQDELLQSSSAEASKRNDDGGYRVAESQTGSPLHRRYLTRSIARQAATLESPEASFDSILDNADSPVFRGLGSPVIDLSRDHPDNPILLPATEASWHTPPSVVADSHSQYNRAIPEFSSPTRILELYFQQFDTSNLKPTSEANGEANSINCPSSVIPAPSADEDSAILTADRSSRIPVSSASLAELTHPTAELHGHVSKEPLKTIRSSPPVIHSRHAGIVTTSPLLHAIASSETSFSLTRSQSDPLDLRPHPAASSLSELKQLPQIISNEPTNLASIQKRPHSPAPPSSSSHALSLSAKEISSQPLPIFPRSKKLKSSHHDANEIHPPPPPTSTLPLTSSLTPALLSLEAKLSLSTRFQPTLQTRPLRSLERGYWLFTVSAWPGPVRVRAWEFLQGYVGKGKAGWGVWCCRSARVGRADLEGIDGRDEDGGEEWRVYCWGEVIGHVYLLLYLASERCIKGAGAKWVDGGGEVVVSMPVGRVRTF